MEQQIDKTIVVTFDDTTRMIDFCKDSEGNVSKDFYEWYLIEQNLFTKSGMLIIDMDEAKKNRIAVFFDFSNPDYVSFTWHSYKRRFPICKFYFNRQENLTMEEVSFDEEYRSLNMFKSDGAVYVRNDYAQSLDKIVKDSAKAIRRSKALAAASEYKKSVIIQDEVNRLIDDSITQCCRLIIYSTYSLMYYVSKQEPKEITTTFNSDTEASQKVKALYKYTGYVDLRENKVYKPLIKKDPDEPVREYERHIQKWTVRGHYRQTKKGKIWIEPHTKGEGELEKRIYGTEDESDLNLIPKVFEVMRSKTEAPTIEKKEIVITVPKQKTEAIKPLKFLEKIEKAWTKIISFLYSRN